MLSCVPCVAVRGSHVAVLMECGNKGGYTDAARRHRLALPAWHRDNKALTTAVVPCVLCPACSPVCTFGTHGCLNGEEADVGGRGGGGVSDSRYVSQRVSSGE